MEQKKMTTEGQLSSNLPVASMSRNPSVKNQRGIVTPLSEGSNKGLQSRGDEQCIIDVLLWIYRGDWIISVVYCPSA